ncbi:sperm flagellar protein 1-like [Lytechinus pictus]|uniref:sperm flagellar protein 1-like n=1 Tax=Lytechinus pictus TaxID=7653 RepID=UPI0030B9AFEA
MPNETNAEEKMEPDDEELQELYKWLDEIPLSRVKKNVGRDFSDAVLIAEVVHHFYPRMVELHNYTPASSSTHKIENWKLLNRKVLAKLNCQVPERDIRGLTTAKAGAAEFFLIKLRQRIEALHLKKKSQQANKAQMSPDGYLDGMEVGSVPARPPKVHKPGAGRPPRAAAPAPKAPTVLKPPPQGFNDPRGASYRQQLNGGIEPELAPAVRMVIEQKEQALLASQETVQILQAKVRRLEHLLKLKDDRIEELMKSVQRAQGHY